jgi:hypothetical protein
MFFAKRPAIGLFRSLLIVSAVLVSVISPPRAQPSGWTRYTSPDLKFSAFFPGNPTVTALPPQEGVVTGTYQSPMLQGCGYQVNVTSLPVNFMSHRDDFSEWFLQYSQAAAIGAINANMHLRTGSEHRIDLAGIPGREFVSENDRFAATQRVYVLGAPPQAFTEYVLTVLCATGREDSALASSFLNSFQIHGGVAPSASVNRDGIWKGTYSAQNNRFFGHCSPGELTMQIDGMKAIITGEPHKNSPGSSPELVVPVAFFGSLDPLKKGVVIIDDDPLIPGTFSGTFSSDSTFTGYFFNGDAVVGQCTYIFSLVRQ